MRDLPALSFHEYNFSLGKGAENPMTISAFIPVYQQPKQLEPLVRSLSAEAFPDSETVVVIDGETTPEISVALNAIRALPRVRIVEGNPHWGKAEALNRAVAQSDSSLFLFLDNDVIAEPGVRLFEGCVAMLRSADIGELPKAALGRGPIAAMMKLEFLSNIAATRILVEKIRRCPSMNGAAFAVRRSLFVVLDGFAPVVNEDVDFSARAFLSGARFGLEPSLHVLNEVPETPAAWLRQRKRWAVSLGLWNATYMRRFAAEAPETANGLLLSSLAFPMPFVAAVAALAAIFRSATIQGGGVAGAMPAVLGVVLYVLCGSYFAREAKYFGQPFSWVAFVPYSLLYLPIWAISSAIGSLVVRLSGVPDMDWKYTSSGTNRRSVRVAKKIPLARKIPRLARSRSK